MSLRRLSRRIVILASAVPLVMGLWSATGARASGPTDTATCQQRAGGAVGPQDCSGPAFFLSFTTEPGGALETQLLNPQPVVEAFDFFGNFVAAYNEVVTLTIGTNPSSGTLSGTTSVQAVNGVATFTDLSIDNAGDGYALVANGPDEPTRSDGVQAADLDAATSLPFDITAPQTGIAPATCNTMYGVTDARSNSRFFSVGTDAIHTLIPVGGIHLGTNFEGIEIGAQGEIFATTAASNKNGQKGMVFQIDGVTGAATPLFSTGFKDVEGLAFQSNGSLWAWVDNKGLVKIDLTGQTATLVLPSKRHFEALAWNPEGNTLYLAEQDKLWKWSPITTHFTLLASNLPGPVLGLDYAFDGNLLLGVAKQQKIIVWSPGSKTTQGFIPTPGYKPIQSLAEHICQNPG